jgi:zinc/manganese transport system substrate-binding protein
MMKLVARMSIGACALLATTCAHAALNVFACEPEWAALAVEVGGDKVSAFSAVTAQQDPHRIEARPSLIARMRSADVLVCTGADLEAGWLPLLLRSGGNARVQPGQPAHFMASDFVSRLEVPTRLDRSEGDVHAYGNPHVHLDPRNLARIGRALGERLAQIDRANAAHYQSRTADFLARLDRAIAQWEAQAAPLKGMRVVAHHRDHVYLIQWLGLVEAANLEPKPGVQPSAAYLATLLERMAAAPAHAVLRSAYTDPKPAQWLSSRARLPVAVLPYTVGGTPDAKDLFGLFSDSIKRLLAVRQAP